MNRLRHDRVIVELFPIEKTEEDKDAFKETNSGIFLAKEEVERKSNIVELRKAIVLKIGHMINTHDLKEGMTVYVKPFQGERLTSDKEEFLFKERDIIGND